MTPTRSRRRTAEPRQERSGGPRTGAGKARSRGNAVRHGLTADATLPKILTTDSLDQAIKDLTEEWRPRTATQRHLVAELARHQVQLERIARIETSVMRQGARGALGLADGAAEGSLALLDLALTGAGTSDGVEKIARYRRAHERGYMLALETLQALQTPPEPTSSPTPPPPRNWTTEECTEHLLERRRRGAVACRCGAAEGHWIAARDVWQCGACRRQTSLRAGTVLEGSRVELAIWFHAIDLLRRTPSMSATDLAAAIGLSRLPTVRTMARKIRGALVSDDRAALLAGLDHLQPVSQPG